MLGILKIDWFLVVCNINNSPFIAYKYLYEMYFIVNASLKMKRGPVMRIEPFSLYRIPFVRTVKRHNSFHTFLHQTSFLHGCPFVQTVLGNDTERTTHFFPADAYSHTAVNYILCSVFLDQGA